MYLFLPDFCSTSMRLSDVIMSTRPCTPSISHTNEGSRSTFDLSYMPNRADVVCLMLRACAVASFLNVSGLNSPHEAYSMAFSRKFFLIVSFREKCGLFITSSSTMPAKLPSMM